MKVFTVLSAKKRLSAKSKPRRLSTNSSFRPLNLAILSIAITVTISTLLLTSGNQRAKAAEEVKVVNHEDYVLLPVPIRTIASGEKLNDSLFTSVKWPKGRLTTEYVSDISGLKEAISITPLAQYLPVPTSSIRNNQIDANAVVEGIPSGMRAITVKVDAESAVEGWAQSGNYVDVILVRNSRNTANGLEATVIAENIKILSAGRSTAPNSNSAVAPTAPNTITLLTSQQDALKIRTGSNLGKLTFALRGAGDELPTTALQIDQRTILGGTKSTENPARQLKGYARGPDGKVYLLNEGSRWMLAPDTATAQSNSDNSEGLLIGGIIQETIQKLALLENVS